MCAGGPGVCSGTPGKSGANSVLRLLAFCPRFWLGFTFLLPFCCLLLPLCRLSVVFLLPLCCLSVALLMPCVALLLPFVVFLLPSVAFLLPCCCRLLPSCCLFTVFCCIFVALWVPFCCILFLEEKVAKKRGKKTNMARFGSRFGVQNGTPPKKTRKKRC